MAQNYESAMNFIGNGIISALLSSVLASQRRRHSVTSVLARFPSSLMHLQQFVRLFWLITHLITTAHSQRLSAVLMHYHRSGTLWA